MKHILIRGQRTFECYTGAELEGKMCRVAIYEVVRPTWKIFRTRYKDSRGFWVDDYDTLQEGIDKMLDHFLKWEQEEAERKAKWSALEKNGKTH